MWKIKEKDEINGLKNKHKKYFKSQNQNVKINRSPDAKSWLIGKDPDAGKDGRQEEKGTTGDEMAGWHHRLNGQKNWLIGKDPDAGKDWRQEEKGAMENEMVN